MVTTLPQLATPTKEGIAMSTQHRRGHSRRDFLRIAGASAVAAGVLPRRLLGAVGLESPRATVGIVRNASIRQALVEAIHLAGGLGFIEPGQTVLLKPNQVAPTWHPMTTNPEVLYELAKLVGEAGARRVFISDQCVGTFTDNWMVAKVSRHFEAAKDAQSDLGGAVEVLPVPLAEAAPYLPNGTSPWRMVKPARASWFIEDGRNVGFQMAELLFQADHVINVPCCKGHELTWFTLTLKNFVGMISVASRTYFHGRTNKAAGGWNYKTSSEAIAELNLPLAPSLNIIDATRPLHSGSQTHGNSTKIDTIIASTDRIAADIVGVALLRTLENEKRIHSISPWQHPMITHAQKLGLGVLGRESMTVKHRGVPNIDQILGEMA
jgi:uncharacterized protein (DUF362 family)